METITVFTDGASKGNPGPGGWGAVMLYPDKIMEIGGGKKITTNNEMELMAVVEALTTLGDTKAEIQIYSDSKYVVQGSTLWIFNWVRNGWKTKTKTDVLNKELWQQLLPLLKVHTIEWHKIPGHVDLNGNECADRIASDFAEGKRVDLYNGSIEEYGHDVADVSYDLEKAKERSDARKRQAQKAYSYISMVDGKIQTHATWPECEARVKGKKGVRFKKAISAKEEKEIIIEFEK